MLPNFSAISTRHPVRSQDSSSEADDEHEYEDLDKATGRSQASSASSRYTKNSQVGIQQKSTLASRSHVNDSAGHLLSNLSLLHGAARGDETRGAVSVFKPSRAASSVAGQSQASSRVTSYAGGKSSTTGSSKPKGSSLFRTMLAPLSRSRPKPPEIDPDHLPADYFLDANRSTADRSRRFVSVVGNPENRQASAAKVGLLDQQDWESARRTRRLQQREAHSTPAHGPALSRK